MKITVSNNNKKIEIEIVCMKNSLKKEISLKKVERAINSHTWIKSCLYTKDKTYNDYACAICSYYLCEYNKGQYTYNCDEGINVFWFHNTKSPNLTCEEILLRNIIE